MITHDQAVSIVADYWNKDVQRDGDEFQASSIELTVEGDFWLIRGNAKACVADGDQMRMAVGISGFIVDSDTGALKIAGSAQDPSDILDDCRDDKKAAGRHYVLAGGTGSGALEEVSALRGVFPVGMARARQFLMPPERYWFIGKRRLLQNYQRELSALGMPTEILLLDQAPDAIEVDWRSRFSWDLSLLTKKTEAEQGGGENGGDGLIIHG